MKTLGKLQPVELREVWKDEARHFTPWLASEEGLELLGDALGLELELIGTEQRVGVFKADILARVAGAEEDQMVVIENQLETTNHDHLGKIVAYAAGHGARYVVWVAKDITEEHRKALDWLNENMPEVDFFALQIVLLQIGDSLPAPQLKRVSEPNQWAKAVKSSQSRELSETRLSQQQFWTNFLDFARKRHDNYLPLTKEPKARHVYVVSTGKGGYYLVLRFITLSDRLVCDLQIDHEMAKKAYDALFACKEELETAIGEPLIWQRMDDQKRSKISLERTADIEMEDHWPEYIEWLYQTANKFYKAFTPRIKNL